MIQASIRARAVISLAFVLVSGVSTQGQPANDDFADRISLSGTNLMATGHNRGATLEAGESLGSPLWVFADASVWWSWTAPGDGAVLITTAGSEFDAVFSIRTGSTVTNLTEVVWTSSKQPMPRTVVGEVSGGVEYQIGVASHASSPNHPEEGDIVLQIAFFPRPPNDDFADRIGLEGERVDVEASLMGATRLEEEEGRVDLWDPAVWWSWTAPKSGTVTVTAEGVWATGDAILFDPPSMRTAVGVFMGESIGNLGRVGIDSSQGYLRVPPLSAVTFEASAGTAYQIGVSGVHGPGGRVGVNVAYGSAPQAVMVDPPHKSRFVTPGTVVLHAESVDEGGPVAQVEYWITRLDRLQAPPNERPARVILADGAPFTATWSEPTPGDYVVIARAVNDRGIQGDSLGTRFEVLPANDDFADRLPLEGTLPVANVSLGYATLEKGEEWVPGGGTAWWSWVASGSGLFTVSLELMSPVDFPTGLPPLWVFEGDSVPTLAVPVGAEHSDAWPLPRSQVVWEAVGGREYALAVGSHPYGPGTLSITPGSPPGVTLVRPVSGAEFELPSSLVLVAEVADAQSIERVEFYDHQKLLGVVTEPPFELELELQHSPDSLPLRAVAINESGLSAASETVEVRTRSPRPGNDDFDDRSMLVGTGVDVVTNLRESTREAGEPDIGEGGSVWWSWTAPQSGEFTASVQFEGFTGRVARAVAVFKGDSLPELSLIGSDSGGVHQSWPPMGLAQVTFTADAGETFALAAYGIALAAYGTGGTRFQLAPGAPPTVSLTAPVEGTKVLLGESFMLEAAAGDAEGEVVRVDFYHGDVLDWPGGMPLSMRLLGTATLAPFTIEAVFDELQPGGSLVAVATDAHGLQSRSEPVRIDVVYPPPENDLFANRFALEGLQVVTNGSGLGSTLEVNEPDDGDGSVWWTWTAPETRGCTIVLESDSIPSAVSVFSGDMLTGLSLVASEGRRWIAGRPVTRVSWFAEAGVTYQIRVIASGEYSLRLVPSRPPVVTLESDADRVMAGTPVTLRAEVMDPDDDLVRVEFWEYSKGLLGVVDQPPYESAIVFEERPYWLRAVNAVAVDAHGLRGFSEFVGIQVDPLPPGNDDLENRIPVQGLRVWVEGSLHVATLEAGEVWSLDNPLVGSVWWSWTAPASGLAVLTLAHDTCCGGDEVGVFEGSTFPDLETVAIARTGDEQRFAQLSFTAVEGREYQIGVASPRTNEESEMLWSLLLMPMEWGAFRREADGSFVLVLRAGDEAGWRVDVSNDLREWSTLQEAVVVNGELEIQDPAAAAEHQRFYRAVPMWGVE